MFILLISEHVGYLILYELERKRVKHHPFNPYSMPKTTNRVPYSMSRIVLLVVYGRSDFATTSSQSKWQDTCLVGRQFRHEDVGP